MSVEESPIATTVAPLPTRKPEDEVARIRNAFKKLPEPVQDALRTTGQRLPLLRRAAFGFLPIPQDTPAEKK